MSLLRKSDKQMKYLFPAPPEESCPSPGLMAASSVMESQAQSLYNFTSSIGTYTKILGMHPPFSMFHSKVFQGQIAAQQSVHPTAGSLRVLGQVSELKAGSVKRGCLVPATSGSRTVFGGNHQHQRTSILLAR